MLPETNGLTLAGELLRNALASTELSVEAMRSALAVVRSECRNAADKGATVDEIAVVLGVSRSLAEALLGTSTMDPVEVLNQVLVARLQLVIEIQQSPSLPIAGLLGCATSDNGLSLLWYQPNVNARNLVDARARELGVSITHDTFPASRVDVDDAVHTVIQHVGFTGIPQTRLSAAGVSISLGPCQPAKLQELQALMPTWVNLEVSETRTSQERDAPI